MHPRTGLLLASLLLSSCVSPSPPAAEIPVAKVLPLSLDSDFSFRKTKRFLNQTKQLLLPTRNEAIVFERMRANYGVVSALEAKQLQGTYFDFFWRAKRPADITVRLEYRQAKLGNAVRAQETVVSQAKGTIKSSFAVIGDDYLWDGPVTAWRCLLIENNRIVGFTQSYLWK